jgi:hypothetical protein
VGDEGLLPPGIGACDVVTWGGVEGGSGEPGRGGDVFPVRPCVRTLEQSFRRRVVDLGGTRVTSPCHVAYARQAVQIGHVMPLICCSMLGRLVQIEHVLPSISILNVFQK